MDGHSNREALLILLKKELE